ncbi:MAG: tRNA ligase subunit PheS family protein, partial [Thermoplasmataceae archaeon]
MEISENESILLFFLFEKGQDSAIPEENALNSGLSAEEIRSASSWLKIKGLIDIIDEKETRFELGEEGFLYLEDQFPEERLISLLRERKEIPVNEIASFFKEPLNRIALAQAAKLGFPPMNGKLAWDDSKGSKALKEIEERREILKRIKDGTLQGGIGDKILDHLLKRGNVIIKKQSSRKIFRISEPGKEYVKSNPSRGTIGEISPEILLSGSWKGKSLRKYDLNLHGKHVERVGRHPLDYLIREIRSIFLEMGFTEMSGNYMESTGWNMDSLFIPQDHPARD